MSTFKGFSQVKLKKPERSLFDLSHERRTSTRMGKLLPIFISETLPNDTFRMQTEIMLRFAPMIAPIMHRVNCFVHYFYVPNRLLWKDWEAFITNGRLGTETAPTPPNAKIDTILGYGSSLLDEGSLADHLSMATIGDAAAATFTDRTVDLMPFAAYFKVWFDYYRDRNYVGDIFEAGNPIPNLPMKSGDIADDDYGGLLQDVITNLMQLWQRDYQKEYFTSALPWTQRGAAVLMPLVGTGTVNYLNTSRLVRSSDGAALAGAVVSEAVSGDIQGGAGPEDARILNIDTVQISNSQVSINDQRLAFALQSWMERQALGGSRMTETIWAQFNRRTSDGRLQRAEYLGGSKVTCQVSEVLTTAFSEDSTAEVIPPANMAGHSRTLSATNPITYNCEEWGFVIGIMSVMPNVGYITGANRMFFARNSFLDYPWPAFAHLGEQEVKQYELWITGSTLPIVRDEQPAFGYQSRYADWKYIRSSVHGAFRSTMDYWHLNRKFSSLPVLGREFCTFEDELQDRIFAVTAGDDTLWAYIYNKINVKRSLPYFGTPQII